MNEIISALQSAIALNRRTINFIHKTVEDYESNEDKPDWLVEWINKDKESLAQYVRIQKMLKKQLAKEISEEKQERAFKQFWEELE